MEYVKLNNGVEMPLLGYGVFQIPQAECERCVSQALEAGYRSIDTAQVYGNEAGVGTAVRKSGIPRTELFLTTKIWISNAGYEKAAASIDESLRKLQTDYVDLLLIHQAYGDYYGTYRAMEEALKAGKTRAIGVSNFQTGRFVDLALHAGVKPAINQLQCNVLSQQNGIRPILDEFGTTLMAWSPLGGPDAPEILSSHVLVQIGQHHGKTAGQVALRWLTQQGIVAIPKSTHRERMEQNLDIFGFRLSDNDVEAISTLNRHDAGTVDFNDPGYIKFALSL